MVWTLATGDLGSRADERTPEINYKRGIGFVIGDVGVPDNYAFLKEVVDGVCPATNPDYDPQGIHEEDEQDGQPPYAAAYTAKSAGGDQLDGHKIWRYAYPTPSSHGEREYVFRRSIKAFTRCGAGMDPSESMSFELSLKPLDGACTTSCRRK